MTKNHLIPAPAGEWPLHFFSRSEMQCRCGCGGADIDLKFGGRLDRLRMLLGKPVVVLSGFRCEAHNAAVGGAKGSYHVKGRAADLWYGERQVRLSELYEAARMAGMTGFGFYGRFLHVDDGPARMWSS